MELIGSALAVFALYFLLETALAGGRIVGGARRRNRSNKDSLF